MGMDTSHVRTLHTIPQLALPVANLHVVPEHVSSQEACYAEPLAAACRLLEQGIPKPGSRVAIIGALRNAGGGLSLTCIAYARWWQLCVACALEVVVTVCDALGQGCLTGVFSTPHAMWWDCGSRCCAGTLTQ